MSTAIMDKKRSPNRLIVDEATNDDNSVSFWFLLLASLGFYSLVFLRASMGAGGGCGGGRATRGRGIAAFAVAAQRGKVSSAFAAPPLPCAPRRSSRSLG